MTIEEMKVFMVQWNNRFPYDRYFRSKHKIAFMSSAHKESSFINQRLEYIEDSLFRETENKGKEKSSADQYIPNIGQWLKSTPIEEGSTITQADIDAFQEEALLMEEMEKEEQNGRR